MLYSNIDDIDETKADKINNRIRSEIKEWGTQDDFFDKDIGYTKQSWHKCARTHEIPPLSVMLKMAEKLNCDIGYLLYEYNEKRHVIADIQKETGLKPDVIKVILNMKNSFLKLSILNELLQDGYFLAIIDLLYMADYHQEKGAELNKIEDKIKSDYDTAETPEEKTKLKKRYDDYRTEHKLHDANVLANCYRLATAFSRLIDKRYGALPEINTSELENQWKREQTQKSSPILF